MNGKVCVVTGSNSGIGKETALALARMGARVVMVVRNLEKGERAREEVVDETGNHLTDLMICDQSSMESIRRFTGEFKIKYDRLNVLINNAGACFGRRQNTIDGFEQTFAVNYLGPFLLTFELLSLLKSSAPSRVVNIGSGTERSANVDFSDLQTMRNYRTMNAYANSKLILTAYTYELARRLEGTGVTANIVEPGFVATDLGKNSGSSISSLAFGIMRPFQISAKKGAETPVYVASSPGLEDISGKCFSKLEQKMTSRVTYDQQVQRRLWDETIRLLGLAPMNSG
jgi:NAD(P)-dependent dehydrogenase (short-subunit alcohol dehydrogenase family)